MIQYFRKLISLFYENYLNKVIATLPIINTALLIARPTIILIVIKLAKEK